MIRICFEAIFSPSGRPRHLPSYQDFVQSALLAEEASERRQVLGSAATSFTEAAGLLEKANQMLKEQPDMAIGQGIGRRAGF